MAKLIVGNWKMHKTIAETKEHISLLRPLVFRADAEVWLAVPYTDIYPAVEASIGSRIKIGAQNMSELLGGALTGEVSGVMLQEAGASFVLLGHSERRRLFFEDNRSINRKAKLAERIGLRAIVCIGETLEEREKGLTEEVLMRQIDACLEGVENSFLAYEPVWAIGAKEAADPKIVENIHRFCQNYVAKANGHKEVKILYGGAVNPSNCEGFLAIPSVAGLLVGGASLDVKTFAEIVWSAEGKL